MLQSFYDTIIVGDRWKLLVQGLGTTLYISLCSIIIGTLLGCVFALLKISQNRILRGAGELYTTIIRGIPLATQLMIFYFVVFAPLGLDRLTVAILAYGINSGAYCTEIFRGGISGRGYRSNGSRPLARLIEKTNAYKNNFSAGGKSRIARLHKRVYNIDQRNGRCKFYRRYRFNEGRRHDPQRNV